MIAPTTTLKSRKCRANMRAHALELRQHLNRSCLCSIIYDNKDECRDNAMHHLDMAKFYLQQALAEECEKRQPGEPAAF